MPWPSEVTPAERLCLTCTGHCAMTAKSKVDAVIGICTAGKRFLAVGILLSVQSFSLIGSGALKG